MIKIYGKNCTYEAIFAGHRLECVYTTVETTQKDPNFTKLLDDKKIKYNIIDKKKMKIKDSGLPAMVIEQTPKLMRRTKLPIVKAKVGPRVMTLVCDARIYDLIPLKKTVKATVSGIYITDVKAVRGTTLETPPQKKKGFFSRFRKEKAPKEKEEKKASK